MVFVHGGGFTSGAGTTDAYGPERLLDYGVVRKIVCFLNITLNFPLLLMAQTRIFFELT